MFRTSEAINEIATALAAAQGEFKPVPKTRQGKIEGESKGTGKAFSFSYAYADIADVLSNVIPVLSKHGLAVIQPTMMDGGVLTIVTRIVHASGQWFESDYPVCSIQGDHKKMGGALTYSRRYALCSMIGVAPDEDIDGDGADEPAPKQKPAPRTMRGPETRQADPYEGMRMDGNPFDDRDYPGDKQNEPAVSTKAINMGREIKGCKSIEDIDAMKKQPEFKTAFHAMNGVDQAHIGDVIKKHRIAVAPILEDLRAAG